MKRKLSENLKRIHERIGAAAEASGRDPNAIRFIAVTKTVEMDVIRHLVHLGLTDLGESRVQQLVKRNGMLNEFLARQRRRSEGKPVAAPNWHMIGTLQRNKIKHLLGHVNMLHSVDNLRLAEDLESQLARRDESLDVLLEVNASGEKVKAGVAVGAVEHIIEHLRVLPHVRLCGLMTLAPLTKDERVLRGVFARLREIFEDLTTHHQVGPEFQHLSMGMSNDFEEAILEGATIVRLGTALFDGISAEASSADATDR